MKVLITSDTHGAHKALEIALAQMEPIDMFIHLGDFEDGLDYINKIVKCEKHIIGGNNDFFSRLPREKEFFIGSKKVFISHGHKYGIWSGVDNLVNAGKSRKADIIMFGHTHCPYLDVREDMTILNPGSISYPRQQGREPTFILINISKDGSIKYDIYYLDRRGKFVI